MKAPNCSVAPLCMSCLSWRAGCLVHKQLRVAAALVQVSPECQSLAAHTDHNLGRCPHRAPGHDVPAEAIALVVGDGQVQMLAGCGAGPVALHRARQAHNLKVAVLPHPGRGDPGRAQGAAADAADTRHDKGRLQPLRLHECADGEQQVVPGHQAQHVDVRRVGPRRRQPLPVAHRPGDGGGEADWCLASRRTRPSDGPTNPTRVSTL